LFLQVVTIHLPLDGESSHAGLLGQHITLHTLDDRLGRRFGVELFRVILIVDVITNADKFSSVVGTSQENDSDTKNFGIGDAGGVGSIGLENEFVYSDGDRADEEGVEFLIILVAGRC
jgi:hypothetical protein